MLKTKLMVCGRGLKVSLWCLLKKYLCHYIYCWYCHHWVRKICKNTSGILVAAVDFKCQHWSRNDFLLDKKSSRCIFIDREEIEVVDRALVELKEVPTGFVTFIEWRSVAKFQEADHQKVGPYQQWFSMISKLVLIRKEMLLMGNIVRSNCKVKHILNGKWPKLDYKQVSNSQSGQFLEAGLWKKIQLTMSM